MDVVQKATYSKEVELPRSKNPEEVGIIYGGVVTCTVQYLTNTDHIDYVYHVQYIYVGLPTVYYCSTVYVPYSMYTTNVVYNLILKFSRVSLSAVRRLRL